MHYCYLDCEDASKWAGHEKLAQCLLQEDATWEIFRCYNHELPALGPELERFTGILISGSHYSAYEGHQWIRELEKFLRQTVMQHPHIRIIGMCFGCQVLAQALGGRVGKNADGGFVLKVEAVQLAPLLRSSEALRLAAADIAAAASGSSSKKVTACSISRSNANVEGLLHLLESHGDCVQELPPHGILLATSATAPVEMFTLPSGNVLAVQGHAELTAADVLDKILPALTTAGRLSAEEATKSERSLREDSDDAALVQQLYRRFMERGLPEVVVATATASTQDETSESTSTQLPTASAGVAGEAPASGGAAADVASGGGARFVASPVSNSKAQGSLERASPASASGRAGKAVLTAVELLQDLHLAVGAELGKGVSEQQLLRQCNEVATLRYQQLGDMAAATREQLEGMAQRRAEAPKQQLPQLLDELQSQVDELEATMSQLDVGSRKLCELVAARQHPTL